MPSLSTPRCTSSSPPCTCLGRSCFQRRRAGIMSELSARGVFFPSSNSGLANAPAQVSTQKNASATHFLFFSGGGPTHPHHDRCRCEIRPPFFSADCLLPPGRRPTCTGTIKRALSRLRRPARRRQKDHSTTWLHVPCASRARGAHENGASERFETHASTAGHLPSRRAEAGRYSRDLISFPSIFVRVFPADVVEHERNSSSFSAVNVFPTFVFCFSLFPHRLPTLDT